MGRGRRGVPQVSHPGFLRGVLPRAFDLPPGTGEACVFLQVCSLLVYLLYLPSLWLEDQHAAVQQDWSPGVSCRHLEIQQQALFPEFSVANTEEKGSFSETESRSGDPGPRISGQDPLLASRSSLAGALPTPSRVFPVYQGARARFLTPQAGLNLKLHLLPWRVSSCLPLPGGHSTSPPRALISTRRFQQSDRLQLSISAP